MTGPIHIIGATGRSGTALSSALARQGRPIAAVIRNPGRLDPTLPYTHTHRADLTDPVSLTAALADATVIVSTAHARHIPAILAAAPPQARLIALGSTRKFTRWPDAHGNGVLAGETALLNSGRPGIILHPTMIYGAEGEDNVQRLAAFLKKTRVAPLPAGGRALVQPIHQDDVTRALLAAIDLPLISPESLVIAGPAAMPYRRFVHTVTGYAGLGRIPILPLPAPLLIGVARLLRHIPGLPRIGPDEIRRLLEDKAFDITPMQTRLGFTPIPLHEGLARLYT